ncbi:plasma membrane stress response protein-like protein [Xylogone sp. PMI_703]|nr:plasma membrane stress response protein-like protein [Xylogone sp. PMI_703]
MASSTQSENSNYDVDYVIDFQFGTKAAGQTQAEAQFTKLIQALNDLGLATEVRNGEKGSLLIFVKVASESHIRAEVYRSRVQDWLYGVRARAPEKQLRKAMNDEPITPAEKLRLVYLMITKPQNEGGAGITPKYGEWKNVKSIFPLHDNTFNSNWVKDLSTKYILEEEDLTQIRDRFGEKIAFYFSFLQNYFVFLSFPAIFGFSTWVLFGYYSTIYSVVIGLWTIIFIEYWKKKEVDLAVQWGVHGVSRIQHKRPGFKHETMVTDVVTGEKVKFYSPFKRLQRQLLQIPFAICAAMVLGSLIAVCFAIEIFISEIYTGPFKTYLVLLPTIILSTGMPTLSAILTSFASRLTELENYETTDAEETAMIQKIFVLNFITSYLPIFLTAFVYVPFAQIIVPHLDIFNIAVKPFAENEKQMMAPQTGFQIDPNRLRKQVIYFTVTAQIVNLMLEVVVPYVKRKVFRKYKEVQEGRAAKNGKELQVEIVDLPEEKEFLSRVRAQAELGEYDVAADLREMTVQFGYLSLFSTVWPLAGLSFLINNWVELRGDALKIAIETQRPVPWRADTIGPWMNALGFLSWLGSLTTAALLFLFGDGGIGPNGTPQNITGWGLLLSILFSEHLYFAVQLIVRAALSKIDSPGLQQERAEKYAVRKQFLEESLGQEAAERDSERANATNEKITRSSLEEDARLSTMPGHGSPEERFWNRQRGAGETIAIGKSLMAKVRNSSRKNMLALYLAKRQIQVNALNETKKQK